MARTNTPTVIQRIAIISSPSAAGYGNFVIKSKSNSENSKSYHKLIPAPMQGMKLFSVLYASLIGFLKRWKKPN